MEASAAATGHGDVVATIRQVIEHHGRLPGAVSDLGDGDDLYAAGLTSHASVNVMLGLEDAFEVEFPDAMLTRSVFETITSISVAVEQLQRDAA
jgi:acyl carrier protein